MPFEIRIPSSGELGEDITLTAWRKKIGDTVERGDVIAEIEADKGVLEIEAVVDGTLGSISVEEGSSVEPGTVIGTIQAEETAPESRKKVAPAARRMAREAGVDVDDIPGTGPGGVVTRADAENYLGTSGLPAGAAPAAGSGVTGPEVLTPNRKSVIRTVTESHRKIPAVRFAATVSMERALRVKHKGGFLWDSLFVKAAAGVIEKMPVFTGYVGQDGDEESAGIQIRRRAAANIAFALGREGELYAPVVRDAGGLGLEEIDRIIRGYVKRTETGPFTNKDFAEGCFLISNLGKYGLDWFEAMVYPGNSAALSFGGIKEK
ncbi:MAG: 2-oxo acid dehydrogenase subunit E2, partial [Spirochaetia bacterium]